nr:hypothetical protein [Komagataeibacter sp. FNDCF1]
MDCHPQILGTPIKEIHYFARDLVHWDVLGREERLRRMREHLGWIINDQNHSYIEKNMRWFADFLMDVDGPQWFANLFRNRKNDVYCSEFSNLTSLIRGDEWKRVAEVSNHVRVLYTIRNPLYRYWSHMKFHYSLFDHNLDLKTLTTEEYKRIILSDDFWKHGNYSSFIEDAKKNLDPDEFCVMRFEDFRVKGDRGNGSEGMAGLCGPDGDFEG